jgi:HEAT repeats
VNVSRKSLLWTVIVTGICTFGCGPKHVTINAGASPSVQARLQVALAATGDEKRLLFEGLLRDPDTDLRFAAAEELGLISSVQSIPALVNSLPDGDIFVRTAVHQSLIQMGEPAIRSLLAKLTARDDSYRYASILAASITSDLEKSVSTEFLENVLTETRFVRCLRDLCVERVGVPSYPPIARMARVSGKVFVEFSLKDGQADQITTFGHPLLTPAVINVLNQYRFTPENSEEKFQLIVEFEIADSTAAGVTGYDFVFPNYIRIVARPPVIETRSVAHAPSLKFSASSELSPINEKLVN